jgi:hypothetical protein
VAKATTGQDTNRGSIFHLCTAPHRHYRRMGGSIEWILD